MKIIELNFNIPPLDIKNNINIYIKNKKINIAICIKCFKAYKWDDYNKNDNIKIILYKNQKINKFQKWLINKKQWEFDSSSNTFQCFNCYSKQLQNETKTFENNKLECIIS